MSALAAAHSVTTPGQVAATSAGALGFGVFVALFVRLAVIPFGGARMAYFRAERFGRAYSNLFIWVVPGVLIVGGLVGLVVAAIGALTGTTWTSN